MNRPEQLNFRDEEVMQSDAFRLRSMIRRLGTRSSTSDENQAGISKAEQLLTSSRERLQARQQVALPIQFPVELPISEHAEVLQQALCDHQVLVVCGETGSGKSTQLPKICLAAGRGRRGLIGHTQPRRLAARSIAARLTEELRGSPSSTVAYKVRFTDQTEKQTMVKLMTDGILLAETQSDRFLDQYDTIIVDEAHERSLNIDFLLGYLRRLLLKRRDLRVIITSATLDAAKFSNHFEINGQAAPIMEVAGRTYPVTQRYQPLLAKDEVDESDVGERDLMTGLVDAIRSLEKDGPGDVLVFLPTEGEIRAATKRLKSSFAPRLHQRSLEILPLYARLGNKDQNRVFNPGGAQRIILATNVAESSLTVPRIRYVIDSGTARISRYAPRTKVQRLPIEAVSRASADQRAGRCGRIGPGICVRLYSEEDYLARDRYTTPEIRRTNLASVILQTEALKLGRIDEFPFIDPPRPEAIRDGYKTLFELGAVDDKQRLTSLGRQLARLPVDPRVGRMILAASEHACLADVLILASGLEIQDPRERPAEKKQAADEAHAKFVDPTSDFMSLLKVWDFFHDLKAKLSQSQLRKACHTNFLSFNRMREWADLHRQLWAIASQAKMRPGPRSNNYDALHRSLLPGLLSGIAYRSDKFEYTGAGGLKFNLWPGSGLFEKRPDWILVNEIVETTKRYGRMAARIQLDWIEPCAEHLVKRSYNDAHWNRKSSRPMAFEKVTLFGLPIVSRRRVPLGPHDPELARRLFIDVGLVEQSYTGGIEVLETNEWTLAQMSDLAAKQRETEKLVDPHLLEQWYELRLPEHVYDAGTLRKALKKTPELSATLSFQPSDLLDGDAEVSAEHFPDQLQVGSLNVPLSYAFEPGSERDGITMRIPLEGLKQLSSRQLGWMIPGQLETRIVALIRSLPKARRRLLVPAPDTAKRVAERLNFGEGDFYETVARELSLIAEERIAAEDFQQNKLADHLRMNLEVVDPQGETVATGRDLETLRQECDISGDGYTPVEDDSWNRDGIVSWDFEELPKSVTLTRSPMDIQAFPALLRDDDSVSLRLVDLPETATALTRLGLTELAFRRARKPILSQVKWIPDGDQWRLLGQAIVPPKSFNVDLGRLLARKAFVEQKKIPRSKEDWERRFDNEVEAIGIATQDVMRVLPKLFENYHQVRLNLEDKKALWGTASGQDVRQQLKDLFPGHWLFETPWQWLQHLPRYLAAISARLEKLAGHQPKDQENVDLVEAYLAPYRTLSERHKRDGVVDPELTEFRWMQEEYRVSLWAQQLGTAMKISPQRLDRQWGKVRA